MKLISVITPCFNEEGNVKILAERVRDVFDKLPGYDFEHIFSDNASEDNTLDVLRAMAEKDTRVKIICNAQNFGAARSVFNGALAARGDAIVLLAGDLQDPPELISAFIERWEEGYQVVFGIRRKRSGSKLMAATRRFYYRLLDAISEDEIVRDAGDFVLFDKKVQEVLSHIHDANPYLRGLLSALGFAHTGVEYDMAKRHSGRTKGSMFILFSYALTGIINHSLLPLRVATLSGLLLSFGSIFYGLVQLGLKLSMWDSAPRGLPTIAIGMFFLAGTQLFVLGILGEFIGAIYRQTKNLPMVIERERINF